MKPIHLVLTFALAVPASALAGPCVYRTEESPDAKSQLRCSFQETQEACEAEAAKVGSSDWLKAHPPTFTAEKLSCQAVVDKVVAAEKKAGKKTKGKSK